MTMLSIRWPVVGLPAVISAHPEWSDLRCYEAATNTPSHPLIAQPWCDAARDYLCGTVPDLQEHGAMTAWCERIAILAGWDADLELGMSLPRVGGHRRWLNADLAIRRSSLAWVVEVKTQVKRPFEFHKAVHQVQRYLACLRLESPDAGYRSAIVAPSFPQEAHTWLRGDRVALWTLRDFLDTVSVAE